MRAMMAAALLAASFCAHAEPAQEKTIECASAAGGNAAMQQESRAIDGDSERKSAGAAAKPGADGRTAQGKDGCAAKPAARTGRYSPPVSIDRLPAPRPSAQSPGGVTPVSPAARAPDPLPRAPTAVNSCDAGGCWGSGGERYQGGTGNVYLNGSGRQCVRIGTTMQCN